MRRPPLAAPLLLLMCLLACDPAPDSPRLDAIEPPQVAFGSLERLRLTGAFPLGLSVELGSSNVPSLDNRFEVNIGAERALPVKYLSSDTLEVNVPPGLPPGRHDVTVTHARGQSTRLPAAFEVVDRGIQRLVFVTSMRSAHTSEWSDPIRIELRGPNGEFAPTAVPRTLVITSDSATGRFIRSGTDEPLSRMEVTLAPGESGVALRYQDATPGYHTLESSTQGLAAISQTVAVGRLGPPVQVRFTQLPTTPLTAGATVALTVEVLDESGGPASLPLTGIRLELDTDSSAGGLTRSNAEPFHSSVSWVLSSPQGRVPLLYRDTRAASRVRLSARAINQDTLRPLVPDAREVTVVPGPTHRLEVRRDRPGAPRVGEPERFSLHAFDDFGNPTDHSGPLYLETSPVDPGFSPGEVAMKAGRASVEATFTRVQEVTLGVVDPHAPRVRGATPPLPVRPGPPTSLKVTPVGATQRAGQPIPLTLEALDRFGNRVDTPLSVSLSVPGVNKDALRPTTSGTFVGSLELPVVLTQSVAQTHLRFEQEDAEPSQALSTTTGGFTVRPGPTQRLVVGDVAEPGRAGVAVRVHIRAEDGWGNRSEDVHDLTLGAEGVPAGHFTPNHFSGFKGEADVAITLTQALQHARITVEADGLRGQQAGTFPMRPGTLARYALQVPDCVTDADRFTLTLRALDTWGNLATDYTGQARLSVAPFGTLYPGNTGAFSAGVHVLTGLVLGEVEHQVPHDCLRLTATDEGGSGAEGTTCIQLRPQCPAPP
ncbi:MAG: hypothetical protein ABW123_28565 [Cystobacter sp.]